MLKKLHKKVLISQKNYGIFLQGSKCVAALGRPSLQRLRERFGATRKAPNLPHVSQQQEHEEVGGRRT